MAPRPNSGLEAHEEEILGDSPLSDRYFHNAHKLNESSTPNDLEKEEESDEASSIFIGLLTALTLAVIIITVCAFIFRKLRQRNSVLLNEQIHKSRHLEMSSVTKSSQQSPSLHHQSQPMKTHLPPPQSDPQLLKPRRCSSASCHSACSIMPAGIVEHDASNRRLSLPRCSVSEPAASNCRRASTISVESLSQFVFIPPNQGLSLWRGRARILARHVKRHLLKQDVVIHGCFIPSHCRDQLKHIYVY